MYMFFTCGGVFAVIDPKIITFDESSNAPQPPLNPSLPPLKLRGGEGGVMSGGGRGSYFRVPL
jgi:hypothetical protein